MKAYLFLGAALIVLGMSFILSWISPVLVPGFYELPRFVRVLTFYCLGAAWWGLMFQGICLIYWR